MCSKVKTLGEASDDESNETATDWIEKSRKLQEERMMAAKREQMLREMDEDVEADDHKSVSERPPVYSTRDLAGLTVEHSKEAFMEGKSVVLTLKDAHVLDEDEPDVLYNVNLLDSEKAEKNVELKKCKPDYNPYMDDEFDEFGVLKEKKILEKYDEEIEGEKPKSFQLGAHGGLTAEEVEEERKIRARLSLKGESLQYSTGNVASEYYSQEEMVQFKKPKKKKRVVRKALKADDLLPLDDIGKDHGSRHTLSDSKMDVQVKQENIDMEDVVPERANDVSDMEEDEAEADLQKALQRARRVKASVKIGGVERVGEMLSNTAQMQSKLKTEQPEGQGKIVLSSIAEFCRTVGEKPQDIPERHHSEEKVSLFSHTLSLLK
jgi:U4/U6.U5 tri-snRNP-associated protein 1